MTRENQLLHGQLLRVRQQHDELSAAAREHRARARPRAEELGEREAERGSAVRLYQQALDQRQRNPRGFQRVFFGEGVFHRAPQGRRKPRQNRVS